jgi:hypothetical protein
MPISEFSVSVDRTINLGNYENLKIDARVDVTINEGEDYEALREEAKTKLRALLEDAYRISKRQQRSTG